jgi:cell division protein FtsI (penicillin-binding protein 3)
MIQPIIVKEVRMADATLEKYETKVLNEKICSEKTLQMVKRCLEGVVERGTARNINNSTYKIAGKTGTTQKIVNKEYTKNYYTSFAGYFPADKPKYSCIVVIDNPKGFNRYGADVAAPVFKEIADKIYSRDLEIHEPLEKSEVAEVVFPVIRAGYLEDLKYLCNEMAISNHAEEESEEWVEANPVNNSIAWIKRDHGRDAMPDVTGMRLKDALYILENMGLQVRFSGTGRVSHQSVGAGTKVDKGTQVFLTME